MKLKDILESASKFNDNKDIDEWLVDDGTEDEPDEPSMQNQILQDMEFGKLQPNEAWKQIAAITTDPEELDFWKMEFYACLDLISEPDIKTNSMAFMSNPKSRFN